MADPDRPDVRRPRPDLHVRLGDVVAQDRPARRSPADRARPDRRRPAHPRPPRRQPRRRRTRPARRRRHASSRPTSGARRLGGNARGLDAWDTTRLEAPGRPTIDVTATPCRHGPPGATRSSVTSSASRSRWPGQQHGALWISGDTVLLPRRPRRRPTASTSAPPSSTSARSASPSPDRSRYTMNAHDAARARPAAPADHDVPGPLRRLDATSTKAEPRSSAPSPPHQPTPSDTSCGQPADTRNASPPDRNRVDHRPWSTTRQRSTDTTLPPTRHKPSDHPVHNMQCCNDSPPPGRRPLLTLLHVTIAAGSGSRIRR